MTTNLSVSNGQSWQPTGLATTLLSSGARQVVRCWLDSPGFLDEQQHPRILLSVINEPGTFSDLVHTANTDLVPAVVLNELLRKGIVEALGSGHVLLRRSAYAPVNAQEVMQSQTGYDNALNSNSDRPRRRYNDI